MLPGCGAEGLDCSGDSLTPCWLRTSDMASHLILSLFKRWSNWGLERLSNLSKVIGLVIDTTQIQVHITLSIIMVLTTYTQGTLPLALRFLFYLLETIVMEVYCPYSIDGRAQKVQIASSRLWTAHPGLGISKSSPRTMADDRKRGGKRRGLRS